MSAPDAWWQLRKVRRLGAAAWVKENGCPQMEGLGELACKLLRELLTGLDQENGPAEGVQALQILLAFDRIARTILRQGRQTARNEGRSKKTEVYRAGLPGQ